MVDFSKPINNADMVENLNALIHRNMDLLAFYDEDLNNLLEDERHIDSVQELKTLHQRHADRLGSTVLMLGGAPDYREDRHRWVGKSKIWLSKLRHDAGILEAVRTEEEKLLALYEKSLQTLRASPESVAVIQQALEEGAPALGRLHEATGGEQA